MYVKQITRLHSLLSCTSDVSRGVVLPQLPPAPAPGPGPLSYALAMELQALN